jgi:GT2 family glycosyltransferase
MFVAKYPMNRWNIEQTREVDILKGACMIIRREALDRVGLLDEEYFMYSEEVDLCTRLTQSGWHLYWVPSAEVIHFGGQSTQQVAEEMFLRLYQGKIMYFRKHQSNLAVMVYKFILCIAALVRLVLTPFALLEEPTQRRRHLDLSHNYRQLLISLPSL